MGEYARWHNVHAGPSRAGFTGADPVTRSYWERNQDDMMGPCNS